MSLSRRPSVNTFSAFLLVGIIFISGTFEHRASVVPIEVEAMMIAVVKIMNFLIEITF
jgi:hypothetical protein